MAMATSASACVEAVGVGSSFGKSCLESSGPRCERIFHTTNTRRYNPVLKSVPAHCDIRGLLQFQLVAFTNFEVRSPLRFVIGKVLFPSRPASRIFSIGSPETDRGPPLS
jgi:hypothetical protein